MKPTSRYDTRKAIDELAEELNLPNEKWMQDWPYEVVIPLDIEKYINHYEKLTDEDKKFVLMEAIIQATEEQATEGLFIHYCNRVMPILQTDFAIHEYTIHCWSNPDDSWKIGPLMRKLMADDKKLKLLFVCTVNRMRSATAHKIYENDDRFIVKSAGTDKTANIVISHEILNWADSIIVMEKHHRNYIRQHFPNIYKDKKIVCLYIPDDYDYMQAELIAVLRDKVEDVYKRQLV